MKLLIHQHYFWQLYSNSQDFEANAATVLSVLLSALICALVLHSAIHCFLRGGGGGGNNHQQPLPQNQQQQQQQATYSPHRSPLRTHMCFGSQLRYLCFLPMGNQRL